jgi:hypothetical protein
MSKKPSKYLLDFLAKCNQNTYIITQEKIESKNIVHIDKEKFFKDYVLPKNEIYPQRLEISKNLIMLMQTELADKYSYFICLEDDVFIRSHKYLQNLEKDLISNQSEMIASFNFFKPKESWFKIWDNRIRNESIIKTDGKYYAAFSPITKYSKNILLEHYNIYIKHKTIYFHEVLYPTLCKKNNLQYSIINKEKHKMLMTFLEQDDTIDNLDDALQSKYNFIHPVKFGGII